MPLSRSPDLDASADVFPDFIAVLGGADLLAGGNVDLYAFTTETDWNFVCGAAACGTDADGDGAPVGGDCDDANTDAEPFTWSGKEAAGQPDGEVDFNCDGEVRIP